MLRLSSPVQDYRREAFGAPKWGTVNVCSSVSTSQGDPKVSRRSPSVSLTSAFTFYAIMNELAYRMLLALIGDVYEGLPLVHLRKHETALIAEFYAHPIT